MEYRPAREWPSSSALSFVAPYMYVRLFTSTHISQCHFTRDHLQFCWMLCCVGVREYPYTWKRWAGCKYHWQGVGCSVSLCSCAWRKSGNRSNMCLSECLVIKRIVGLRYKGTPIRQKVWGWQWWHTDMLSSFRLVHCSVQQQTCSSL